MALINLVQKLAEGDVLQRHPLSRAHKQHHERNDEQDYDYPKGKIPVIRTHLRSRYWLQGVLISMLGSGRKDCDPNLRRGCASFTPWVIATALQLLPPLGRSSGGNHTINFVETLHREDFGGIGPGTVTASA
jgi:hypothetical protein